MNDEISHVSCIKLLFSSLNLLVAALFLHDVECLVRGSKLLIGGDGRAETLSLGARHN